MSVVSARDLAKSFGAHLVFRNCSFALAWGDRAGLVGPNGAGKSTLLRVLGGTLPADAGTVAVARSATVGYLSQEPALPEDRTVRDAALEATGELAVLQARLAAAEAALARGEASEEALRAFGDLQARFERAGGWEREHVAEESLAGLGLPASLWQTRVRHLSGGQRIRLALCRLLLGEPDLLLCDEPTNHLDLEAVEWLETRLQRWRGALLCVSHDRYFLDRVCSRVLELGPEGVESYPGGYSAYVRQREERTRNAAVEAARAGGEEERLRAYVERYRAGNRARQARSRERRLERLRREAPGAAAPAPPQAPVLRFAPRGATGREVLAVEGLAKSYGANVLFPAWDAVVHRGERIGIVGRNGAGKTTLLRLLAGEERPDAGAATWGHGVELSWLRQDGGGIQPDDTVLEHVLASDEAIGAGEARDILARFLFRGDAVFRRAGDLSGGERHRLLLCLLLLEHGNVLLCDEPTNHLDIPAREALEASLEAFPGTLFVVSHDRYLLRRLCGRIWWLDRGGVRDLAGGYPAYEAARAAEAAGPAPTDPDPGSARSPLPAGQGAAGGDRAAGRARDRSLREQRRRLAALAEVEARIGEVEAEVAALGERLGQADLYADGRQAAAAVGAYRQAEARLQALYAEWERLGQAALQDSPSSGRS